MCHVPDHIYSTPISIAVHYVSGHVNTSIRVCRSWVGGGPPETGPLAPGILSSGGQLEPGHVSPRCPCRWTKPPECSFLVAKHSLQVPLAFLTLGPIWVR